MARARRLPPKLQAVLIRLGRALDPNVTQAVKLPYLIDVVASRVLGGPITGGNHEAWDYGVVTSQAWHHLTKQEDSDWFHLDTVPRSEERRLVIDADEEPHALTAEERNLVDFVAREYGSIKAKDLGRLTKLMNPEISSWGGGRRPSVSADAYDRLSDEYQEMAEAVSRITLDQLRQDYTVVRKAEDALA